MKKIVSILLIFILLFSISGCAGNSSQNVKKIDVVGTYVSEKENGIWGYFSLSLNDDKTFTYNESILSSHFGLGSWEINSNEITLHDNIQGQKRDFIFRYEDGALYFVKDKSDKFLYVSPEDGFKLIKQ